MVFQPPYFLSRLLAACAALCVLAAGGHAQTIPAFPGAEGYGGYAKGGRGGDVYIVTNTNASGAGSFRYGIETVPSAGRTIVFAVSGHIHINGLRLTSSKVTIAGQTAPGDGIGLVDGTFRISGDDVIMRHIRIRHRKSGSGGDCLNLDSGSINSVIDSVSMQFSTDENMSSFGSPPENLTMQWSLNAWGLESHSCGGLWDQNHATAHHTLWAHHHTRNPKARPSGLLEWINNVTFDWDIGFIMGDSQTPAPWKANVIGSYFLSPPGNTRSKALQKATVDRNGAPNFSVHLSNNRHDNDGDALIDGTDKGYAIVEGSEFVAGDPAGANRYAKSTTPFPNTGSILVTTDDPVVAFKKVASKAGALRLDIDPGKPLRDEVDTRLINNLVTQTRNHITRESDLAGVSNGGIGTLNSTAAPIDSDKDGMPDYYETALTWNPAAQDHNTALASSGGFLTGTTFMPAGTVAGYTRLEEYLHFLAIPHGTVAKNVSGSPTSVAVDMRKFTGGFSSSPTFTVAAVTGGTIVLSGIGNAIATFTPTLNLTGRARFDFTVTDSAGHAWTQTCALMVTNTGLPRDLIWNGAGNAWDTALNWLRPATGANVAFSAGDRVAFDALGSPQSTVTVTGANQPGSVDVDASGNYTFSGSGAITSSGELTKRGTGTLTISNTGLNSFTAATLDAGTLALTVYDALGGAPLALNAGTLNLSASTPSPLAVNAPVAINASGANRESTGAWTGSGAAALSIGNNTFSLRGNTSAFAGTIALGGSTGFLRLYGSLGSPLATFNLGTGTADLLNRDGNATIELGALLGGAGTTLTGASATANPTTYSIGATGNSTTFAGAITNNMGVTNVAKVGAGTLTLTGASSHTGTTAVNAGALLVSGSLGSTAVTVAGGALLGGSGTFNGTVTASAASFLSPGTVPFTGATMTVVGGLTLNAATMYCDMSGTPGGANDKIVITGAPLTYAGAPYFQFVLLNGTLAAGDYDLITAPSSSVPGGTPSSFSHNLPPGTRQTFTVKRTGSSTTPARLWLEVLGNPATLTWTGATSGTWDAVTANNWTGATPNTFGANDAVVFDDTSPTRTVALSGSLAPRSIIVNTTAGYTLTGAGTIDGGGSFVKNGPGTLWLAGTSASTFTGGFTLNAGTVAFQTDDASNGAPGTGPVTLNGGTLSMFSNFSSYDNFTAALVVPTGATATINADSRVDVYGSLSGGGTLNFSIPSNRTSIFADWSPFGGVLNATTTGGYAELRMSQAYNPSGFPNATVNLGANVVAVFTGNINQGAGTTIGIGALSGPSTSRLLGGPDFAGSRLVTYRIGGKGTDAVFSGGIYEQNAAVTNTSVVKTGAGTWTLGGTCEYNGGTVVEAGTLKITGSVTCASTTNVLPGATLQFMGGSLSTDALNIAESATLTGGGTMKVTGDFNNDGTATIGSGTFTITGEVVNNGVMRITGGAALSATAGFVNNGTLDLLTGAQGLPPNLENNGVVIDSTTLSAISASKSGGTVTLTVPTHSGHSYQMQRSLSLTAPVWGDVGAAQSGLTQGNGAPTNRVFTDPAATGAQWFYRMKVTP